MCACAVSSALPMMRANYLLSAHRALCIMNTSRQQLTVLIEVSDGFVTDGTLFAVRMDTGHEFGRVASVASDWYIECSWCRVSSVFLSTVTAVSFHDHPAGMLMQFQWLDCSSASC
jgi:hypothetical protein